MERNNKYDKYFNENMTERQADLTFFKTMKEIPHEEDVKDLFDAYIHSGSKTLDK